MRNWISGILGLAFGSLLVAGLYKFRIYPTLGISGYSDYAVSLGSLT